MDTIQECYDVTILGGGLSGLALARQLLAKHADLRILIIEKRAHPVAEAAFKVGESTVEIGAHYLGSELELRKHLAESHLPKFGLRFFFCGGHDSLKDVVEVGPSNFFPAPGFQVDRGRLENYLANSVSESGGHFVQQATVKEIELATDGEPHRVTFECGSVGHAVQTRWVIDASGRAALLKRKLGLQEQLSHNINAAWFRIGTNLKLDSWCDDPQWQTRAGKLPRRWLSTNHLLGHGYWLWIIPLVSGSTSIGIVADPRLHPISDFNKFESAMAWLEQHEPICAAAIRPHCDRLQDFKAIKQIAHGCREVYSANRWAITGEAGVFLDPLYSPGVDYIAMANTQICSLIEHDLTGESLNLLAARYQGIFMTLFKDNLLTYENQYPLFGNPRVMSLKYVWDYSLYWGFPALLYFNHKLTDPRFFSSLGDGIERIRQLNREMQSFFRDWHAADSGEDVDSVFVNQNEIAVLSQLNGELADRLDDPALYERFQRNVTLLEDLSAEIMGRVRVSSPSLLGNGDSQIPPKVDRLDGVFEALGM